MTPCSSGTVERVPTSLLIPPFFYWSFHGSSGRFVRSSAFQGFSAAFSSVLSVGAKMWSCWPVACMTPGTISTLTAPCSTAPCCVSPSTAQVPIATFFNTFSTAPWGQSAASISCWVNSWWFLNECFWQVVAGKRTSRKRSCNAQWGHRTGKDSTPKACFSVLGEPGLKSGAMGCVRGVVCCSFIWW